MEGAKLYTGQKVVCINSVFPVKATTDIDKSIIGMHPLIYPIEGEILVIDEMLGDEWVRFDKYDNESFNWWHESRFKPFKNAMIATFQDIAIIEANYPNMAESTIQI